MPTNLPQYEKTFVPVLLIVLVLVPIVYGIAAYDFIQYEKAQLAASKSSGTTGSISPARSK